MPTNLHALIRYRTIDKSLRKVDQIWSWKELSEACSKALLEQTKIDKVISRRTVMYDLNNMKSGKLGYYAPIEYDRKEKSYYYSDPKFSIDFVPIKKEELDELNNALLILKQFSGKASVQGLENVVTKLEETLKIKRGGRRKEIIQFDHSLNEPGQKWVNIVYEAIKNNKALTITYQPFDKDPYFSTVSPYLLKEYNNRWFLFAFEHKYKSITNLGLDRIQEIKESLQPYRNRKEFDQDSYLNDILGVTFPEGATKEKIVIKAYGKQRLYIQTKPIHQSQQTIEMTEDFGIFSLDIIPNYELQSQFLGYGETLEVTSPKWLRKKMKELFEKCSEFYS